MGTTIMKLTKDATAPGIDSSAHIRAPLTGLVLEPHAVQSISTGHAPHAGSGVAMSSIPAGMCESQAYTHSS
jgi:hypothetical protein